jgi:hypothetical protein
MGRFRTEDATMGYQVGSWGAGGEWHVAPATAGEVFTRREDAEYTLERIYELADVPEAERTDLVIREVQS